MTCGAFVSNVVFLDFYFNCLISASAAGSRYAFCFENARYFLLRREYKVTSLFNNVRALAVQGGRSKPFSPWLLVFLPLPCTESKSSFLLCALLERCWSCCSSIHLSKAVRGVKSLPWSVFSACAAAIPSALLPQRCTKLFPQIRSLLYRSQVPRGFSALGGVRAVLGAAGPAWEGGGLCHSPSTPPHASWACASPAASCCEDECCLQGFRLLSRARYIVQPCVACRAAALCPL